MCGEKRSVGDLKKHGDFDDIYLKVMPRKTINLPIAKSDYDRGRQFCIRQPGGRSGRRCRTRADPTFGWRTRLRNSVAVAAAQGSVFPVSLTRHANAHANADADAHPTAMLPLPANYTQRLVGHGCC